MPLQGQGAKETKTRDTRSNLQTKMDRYLSIQESKDREKKEYTRKPPSTLLELIDELKSEGINSNLVMAMEKEDKFIISPKGYIGDPWMSINKVIRRMGGEWISAQERSRWIIKK
jgi:hypothetical protein